MIILIIVLLVLAVGLWIYGFNEANDLKVPTRDINSFKNLNKVLIIGATSLGLIAVMPLIIQGITGIQEFAFMIGGTALIIIVSVALETMRQIDSQLEMREYDL